MSRPDKSTDDEQVPRALTDAVLAALAAPPRLAPGLHVVATPIGNLADVTLRALSVLARADVVACEDTRMTRRLLDRYGLAPRLVSYHEHNAAARRPELMARLEDGATVALVSDAGTPMISDPGYKLVRDALESGHQVHVVPGASAVLAGLVLSGLPTDHFWFEGFLPPRSGARRQRIERLRPLEATLVLFESPRRVAATLADLAEVLGDREAAMAREMTKKFETVLRGTLPELAHRLEADGPPKGEVVLIVGPPNDAERDQPSPESIDRRLVQLTAEMGTREAAARLAAETGLKRRDLYQRALVLGKAPGGDV